MPRAGFAEILRLLARSEVEFIVVGMTAGVLQGAPATTLDVDVVLRTAFRSPENVARLLAALRQLGAVYQRGICSRTGGAALYSSIGQGRKPLLRRVRATAA